MKQEGGKVGSSEVEVAHRPLVIHDRYLIRPSSPARAVPLFLKNGFPAADKGDQARTQSQHAFRDRPRGPVMSSPDTDTSPQRPLPGNPRRHRREPTIRAIMSTRAVTVAWTTPSIRPSFSMNIISITCWSCRVGNCSALFQIGTCSGRKPTHRDIVETDRDRATLNKRPPSWAEN